MSTTPRWHQALLPDELRDQPGGRRSARDWVVDVVMSHVAVGIGLVVIAESASAHTDALWLAEGVLGLAALVLLWWRRSHPAAVGVATTLASVVSGFAAGPALVAAFNVALRGSRRAILALLAATAVAIVGYPLVYPSENGLIVNAVIGTLLTVAVIGWGLFARARREQVLALRERAARLEAEQRLRIDQARDAERRAIAREMHDVLAHRVSLLSLHAGALEFRPDAPPEEIAEAAGVIRKTAHAALEELRQVIGVLRDNGDPDAPERPQPTLADVPALVAESRAAGMRVSCALDVPDAEAVPDALGRTVYRVVQEGLTNARKHAAAAAVEVDVTGAPGELRVRVLSRRPVGVAAQAAQGLPGAGSGLIGLAERVALAGGELRHGPDAAGDFVLEATLPR